MLKKFSVSLRGLLGAENAVAGVAQAGDDVAVLVEVIVERASVDVDVGELLLNGLDALGSGDEHHERDVLAAALLHFADGLARRAAGGEHRIDDDDVALGNFNNNVAALAL